MRFVCPLIVVRDIRKARRLYEDMLGQKVKADYGTDIVFEGDFAIHQESHFKKIVGFSGQEIVKRSNSFELYFETDELAEMFTRLARERLQFIHGIREQPWGQMVMRLYDHDGHMIEIGETMDGLVRRLQAAGLARDQITAKTGLPAEFVDNALGDRDAGGG